MRRKPTYIIYFLLLIGASATLQAEEIKIGQFSTGELTGWQEKSFAGHTQYQIVALPQGNALQAKSNGTASGLFKEVTIDLTKTPWLNWSWRIDNTVSGNNERNKKEDDYPARVYVVVSGGIFFWKTLALNYVWSNQQAINTQWDNPYTSNAKMVAVRSGAAETGKWVTQKQNVLEDLQKAFGKEITTIHAIAVMTDSDNTNTSTAALYGNIFFSDR